jgi:hypothetical protein
LYAEDDGTLYCVSDGASILRVDKNMKTLWSRRMGGRPALVFRQQDGVILTVTEKGRVEGYSRLGDLLINFALPWQDITGRGEEHTTASLLLRLEETPEGWIYIFTVDGRCAVFSRGGGLLAQWKTPQTPACPPVVYRGKIVCALEDGSLRAYKPSGRPAWETEAAAPALLLAVNPYTHTLAAARKDGRFESYAVSPVDTPQAAGGQPVRLLLRRSLPFETAHILSLESGGHVLVGRGGRIITLNAEGEFTEDFFLKDGRPAGAATDGKNALFLAEQNGKLSSYSLAGAPLWTTTLTGKPGTPTLSPSSRYLAVGTHDWVVQRFEFVQYGRAGVRLTPAAAPPADPLKIHASSSLYRGEYDFIYFMDRAASDDAEKKKECLDIAAGRLDKGNLNLSLDYVSVVLRYLAAEPYARQGAKSYPDLRARALRLLAAVGDAENRDFFSAFLTQEKDEFITRAVLGAMGAQRSDPDEVMRRGIYSYVQSNPRPAGRLGAAVVDALDEISAYHGGLGQYGRAALMRLLENSSAALRRRIQSLLANRP